METNFLGFNSIVFSELGDVINFEDLSAQSSKMLIGVVFMYI